MNKKWLRRTLLALACLSAIFVAACGGESTVSALTPSRFIVFGDGLADAGQNGAMYTVNGASDYPLNWTQKMAAEFGLTLTASSQGGTNYARGNARIATNPDAAGHSATWSVAQQVEAFTGTDSFGASDVAVLSAGVADIIAEMAAELAGTQTPEHTDAHIRQAAQALGTLTRTLVKEKGARYVVLSGPYNLDKSPWASATGQHARLNALSRQFSDSLLVSVADLGRNVFYIDMEYYFNLMATNPESFGMNNASEPVCNSVDSEDGIGIGMGEVNSLLCTKDTLTDQAYNNYMFADKIYVTPYPHYWFGLYAAYRLNERW